MTQTVGPDFDAVTATDQLSHIIGALLTIGLITAVGMLIVCAITWAIASSAGAWHSASRAKAGVLVAVGGAVLTGGALAWTNWLLHTGSTL
ncbi:DUF6112 family protein [Georgenia yuyongxinii]|uniref:Integral membrane protein n=1 Tax=Georgenia yuyongxinii TaxID=2589797 RepID=A0A552WX63_9MICO|nr:DUF6112 family protein [Georgenia yuyongxinii]TRW47420.1 hypothetical protein FJ693_01055 [Georgenia yuyongxinii]